MVLTSTATILGAGGSFSNATAGLSAARSGIPKTPAAARTMLTVECEGENAIAALNAATRDVHKGTSVMMNWTLKMLKQFR